MYDYSKPKHSDNGHQSTDYYCDGTHHEMAQPKVDVPMVENNEYPIGMKPMEGKPQY